jgi:UMF1 family MFS transporter
MSVYATRAFGLSEVQIINLITFSTLFAILGSILSGVISDRVGARVNLTVIYILWIVTLMFGALVKSTGLYWLVGSLVGMILGGTWVVSRALAIQLVPAQRIGEAFGLFNLVGYISAIVGSLFWGLIILVLSSYGALGYRVALLSLNLFLILGVIFLLRVPNKAPAKNF